MSSEIKVDTISEQTSANGVAVDGVTLKDNGITASGDISFDGGSFTFNESSADKDFRIETNGNSSMFFVDGGNDAVIFNGGTSDFEASSQVIQVHNSGVAFSSGYGIQGGVNADRASINLTSGASGHTVFKGNNAETMRILNNGQISTGGETAPDCSFGGFTLDQNAQDNEILTFKSSDIAHGATGIKQTDTYGFIEPKSGANGGIKVGGLVEAGTIAAVEINATVTDVDSDEASGAEGGIQTQCMKKSGTGNTGMGSDDNIFVCRNNTTKFIVKGDGELFSDQSATVGTFDEYEDAHLVRAYDLSHGKGVIDSSFDKFVKYNKDDLQKARLIGSDKKGNATPFVNITGMSRLHNGAIWQQYEKHQKLANAVYELAKAAVGEDKANEILEQNEIKLLN
jgi:hypothetical protein